MGALETAFLRLQKGDFKGAFAPAKNVTVENDPQDSLRHRLRFGEKEDDYFLLALKTEPEDEARLCEILSKVIESPAQLKKIRNMPVEKRPELAVEVGMNCDGFCRADGSQICISESIGTGYRAAAIFCHEFQHQYQCTHDGMYHYKEGLSLPEDILDDRLYEAAAETSAYQYLYDIRNNNPQAGAAYLYCMHNGGYAQGLKAYAAAKKQEKPESDCVLAGMKGYAENYGIARWYEKAYHREICKRDPNFGIDKYADYLHDGMKEEVVTMLEQRLGGKRLDETAAFLSHTVGMTDVPPEKDAIQSVIRSAEFAFVTPLTMRALNMYKETYQNFSGQEHPESDRILSVRDTRGVYQSSEPEREQKKTLRGHLRDVSRKAKKALHPSKEKTTKSTDSEQQPIPFLIQGSDKGQVLLSLDGRTKEFENFTGAVFYRPSAEHPSCQEVPDEERQEFAEREKKLSDTMRIVLNDEDLRKKLTEHSSANPLIIGFCKNPDFKPDVPMIMLDPRKSAEDLAQDFKKQYREISPQKKVSLMQGLMNTAKKKETEKQQLSRRIATHRGKEL